MHREAIENVDLNCSLPTGTSYGQVRSVRTPRPTLLPTPNFLVQAQTFSTKKVHMFVNIMF